MWLKFFEYMSLTKSITPLGTSFSSKIFKIHHRSKLANSFLRSVKHISAGLLNSKALFAICFTIETASIQDRQVLLHIGYIN